MPKSKRDEVRDKKKKDAEEAKKIKGREEPKSTMEIDPSAPKTKKDFRRLRERERHRAELAAKNAKESQFNREAEERGRQLILDDYREDFE